MPIQVSPGVNISEIDLTTTVPAVSTTTGAIAGIFRWGPVEDPVLISNKTELADRFGKPSNTNYEAYFTAESFLSYGNSLYVSRGVGSDALNATGGSSANGILIKNSDSYDVDTTNADTNENWIAKYPGSIGNSLKVSVCPSANAYEFAYTHNPTTDVLAVPGNSDIGTGNVETFSANITTGSNTFTITVTGDDQSSDIRNTGAALLDSLKANNFIKLNGTFYKLSNNGAAAYQGNTTASANVTLTYSLYTKNVTGANVANTTTFSRYWEYHNLFDTAPGRSKFLADRNTNTSIKDEFHLVVVDEDGQITGQADEVLEIFQGLSSCTDGKTEQGADNFYKTALRDKSNWIYWGDDTGLGLGTPAAAASFAGTAGSNAAVTFSLEAGEDGANQSTTAATSGITAALDKFVNNEEIDISVVMAGKALGGTNDTLIANYIIDNICDVRKDCVACISPSYADAVSGSDPLNDVIAFRDSLTASSFGIMDSGYKYMYDKYNDVYRWIPLNGDVAGAIVRTDDERDPWFSPGGFQRGVLKNVVKLGWNPTKAQRDELYKKDINPIVTFPGQGVVLFGDKTLLGRPSAFDRINVRRLFIVLEKAIARAAQSQLFEFNDEFTRTQFKNIVEPFLRDVQGRRGIYDFKVICDETNNTGNVIDSNQFVGDIFIKPAKSINFIQLNFVAVRTGVEFNEIIGSV